MTVKCGLENHLSIGIFTDLNHTLIRDTFMPDLTSDLAPDLAIVIGNKNYSSWSLRGWLALKRCGVEFDEIMIQLDTPETRKNLLDHSKAGLVPVLKHQGQTIWETMAICEYLAETYPAARLWPEDKKARAHCRSVCNEMHAGFAALRTHMPMDIRNSYPGSGRGDGVQANIDRIFDIWQECRDQFGENGPFLYGDFTVADAMFAPVVARFKTFAVELPEFADSYCNAIWECPDMVEWRDASQAEPWVIE